MIGDASFPVFIRGCNALVDPFNLAIGDFWKSLMTDTNADDDHENQRYQKNFHFLGSA